MWHRSSLDSALNAVAGVVTTDWVRLYLRGVSPSGPRFLALSQRASAGMAALTVGGALGMGSVHKESANDLYNGLMSITGGASAGLIILTVFTRSELARDGGSDRRWCTPLLDATTAMAGIGGSLLASAAAALCSFGGLSDSCSLSYYWVLPLSNLAFVVCVCGCVLTRRAMHCCAGRHSGSTARGHGADGKARLDETAGGGGGGGGGARGGRGAGEGLSMVRCAA